MYNDDPYWPKTLTLPFGTETAVCLSTPEPKEEPLPDPLDVMLLGLPDWLRDDARRFAEKCIEPPDDLLAAVEDYFVAMCESAD